MLKYPQKRYNTQSLKGDIFYMAPLPKKKHSIRRGRVRQDAKKLQTQGLVACTNCGAMIFAHVMCPKCGFYKGREVIAKKPEAKVTVRTNA